MSATIRTLLLVCLLLGIVGTAVDLFLIGHYEDPWQWAPLVLLGVSIVQIGWCLPPSRIDALGMLRPTMLFFLVAGVAGLWFHFHANMEFEREVSPTLQGAELVWKAIRGAAPPSLAPAAFMQLGFLGLICSYGCPRRGAPVPKPAAPGEEQ